MTPWWTKSAWRWFQINPLNLILSQNKAAIRVRTYNLQLVIPAVINYPVSNKETKLRTNHVIITGAKILFFQQLFGNNEIMNECEIIKNTMPIFTQTTHDRIISFKIKLTEEWVNIIHLKYIICTRTEQVRLHLTRWCWNCIYLSWRPRKLFSLFCTQWQWIRHSFWVTHYQSHHDSFRSIFLLHVNDK